MKAEKVAGLVGLIIAGIVIFFSYLTFGPLHTIIWVVLFFIGMGSAMWFGPMLPLFYLVFLLVLLILISGGYGWASAIFAYQTRVTGWQMTSHNFIPSWVGYGIGALIWMDKNVETKIGFLFLPFIWLGLWLLTFTIIRRLMFLSILIGLFILAVWITGAFLKR